MIPTLMGRLIVSIGITSGLATASWGADRPAEFEKLDREYQAAEKAFYDVPHRETLTTDETIARYEAWPGWKYVPKAVTLAEVQPGDTTAYKCCQWIVHRIGSIGNWDRDMYEADEKAWDMIAAHNIRNLKGKDYQLACFEAVEYVGPARERFLRA